MRQRGKITVLVGGCFDLLHPGHVIFLGKAKKLGDKLIVLLESDKKVRLLKGDNRPVHTQKDRAKVLSALKSVDQVICLPFMDKESQYDKLVAKIRPGIIASTKDDSDNHHKAKVAKLVGAKLKVVMDKINKYSTTRLLKDLLV